MPDSKCKWCGMEVPAEAEKRPWCYRARPATAGPTPRESDDAPADPVIGQEEFGSLASFKSMAHHDPAMFGVLVLMGLQVLGDLLSGRWIWFVVSALVLWGIVQWTRWAFWVVIVTRLAGMWFEVVALLSFGAGWGPLQSFLFGRLAIDSFVFFVVIVRRDRFA